MKPQYTKKNFNTNIELNILYFFYTHVIQVSTGQNAMNIAYLEKRLKFMCQNNN